MGIQTYDKHFEFDVIVFATGFDAITGPLLKLNIQGADGLKLGDVWQNGPRSYLGLQVPGFPNLFTITGPGSPSVLGNVPVAIEQHVDWITDCIAHLKSINAHLIEPSQEATSQWHERVQEAANATFRLPDPQGILNGTSDQAKDHFGCGFGVAKPMVGQVG